MKLRQSMRDTLRFFTCGAERWLAVFFLVYPLYAEQVACAGLSLPLTAEKALLALALGAGIALCANLPRRPAFGFALAYFPVHLLEYFSNTVLPALCPGPGRRAGILACGRCRGGAEHRLPHSVCSPAGGFVYLGAARHAAQAPPGAAPRACGGLSGAGAVCGGWRRMRRTWPFSPQAMCLCPVRGALALCPPWR